MHASIHKMHLNAYFHYQYYCSQEYLTINLLAHGDSVSDYWLTNNGGRLQCGGFLVTKPASLHKQSIHFNTQS